MKDEYIIINKTEFEKILEELEDLKRTQHANGDLSNFENTYGKIEGIKQTLSKSTPLIPVIDRAYDAGKLDKDLSLMFDNPKARYISNLKLEI